MVRLELGPCLKVQSRLADSHEGMLQKRVCLVLLAVVATMSGGTSSSWASVLRAMSLGELTLASDSIVVGSVVSVSAAWDLQHRRIISTIEVEVEQSWKGSWSANRRITLVQPGGSVGDIEMTVGGMPSFSVGEKSLLFLQGQSRLLPESPLTPRYCWSRRIGGGRVRMWVPGFCWST